MHISLEEAGNFHRGKRHAVKIKADTTYNCYSVFLSFPLSILFSVLHWGNNDVSVYERTKADDYQTQGKKKKKKVAHDC